MGQVTKILGGGTLLGILLTVIAINMPSCEEDTPEVPYPDYELPLTIQEYIVEHFEPCTEIWEPDFVCDVWGSCRVFLMCDAPEYGFTAVDIDIYCPDLEAGLDEPDREPCSLALLE